MSEKICPLNNMNPCMGNKCIFFLDDLSAKTIDKDKGLELEINVKDMSVIPCAIIVGGVSSFQCFAKEQSNQLFRAHQENK